MNSNETWKIKQDRIGPLIIFIIIACFGGVLTYGVIEPDILTDELPRPVTAMIAVLLDLGALIFLMQFLFPVTYLTVTTEGVHILTNTWW